MAISPTMNDQWSGKILSRTLSASNFDEPKRSSALSRTLLLVLCPFAGGGAFRHRAHRRLTPRAWPVPVELHLPTRLRLPTRQSPDLFQKPGPIGSMKSLRATK